MDRPSVFFVGKRKPDAPPEPQMTAEEMKECIARVQPFLRKRNQEERMERTLETLSFEEKRA